MDVQGLAVSDTLLWYQ